MLESRRRAIIFLVISFLLASSAGLFFLQKVKAINSELGGMTKIYVAAAQIPSRSLIQPNQVKVVEIPNRFVNNAHVTDVKELINKVLVVPLSEDDMITKNMIKPVSETRSENDRLVTLFYGERTQADQPLQALDRVDIIVSQRIKGQEPITEVFMKDVLVSAVIANKSKISGISVEVPADDAPRLIHMQNYADSLRILKANVGQGEEITAQPAGEKPAEAPPAAPDKAETEPTKKEAAEQAKPTEPAKNPDPKK
ncbi:Flp pilus assembly protein CpaB [Bacillus sp. FJAT-27245]|uniref:Flp pilus assembly protein CpaB n=1 Tax=Bacillus sp. FJAT-27245 TaxID=1684144 RepID=UPI0009E762AB|nr:SAF domain-containing protein [Bacillus sp. FJAT-27245]